jgi:hypothetical protein
MIRRLRESTWALLIALDILACTIWLAPLYVLGLASKPSGRRLISSYVGHAASNGHRWAKRAAAVIDWLAKDLGAGPDHCYRSWKKYEGRDD